VIEPSEVSVESGSSEIEFTTIIFEDDSGEDEIIYSSEESDEDKKKMRRKREVSPVMDAFRDKRALVFR
jgi:hypothetical protein